MLQLGSRSPSNTNIAWKSELSPVPDNVEAVMRQVCAGMEHTKSTAVAWKMEWTAKGLTPVRPLVILKKGIRFDPKSYLKLV